MTAIDGDQKSQGASNAVRQPDDAYLWGYVLFALGSELILATLAYLESIVGGLLIAAFFLLFVPLTLIMIIVALTGIVALVKGRFKRAAPLLLASFIFVSPFLFPVAVAVPQARAFDLVRFYVNRSQYAEIIDKLPPDERASKVMFFKWGSTRTSEYWLVYDESGEVALADAERTQAWKDRVYPEHGGEFTDKECETGAYRLSGHYYSMVVNCTY